MSYILEALKKIEQQKERDKGSVSWVHDLTAIYPENKRRGNSKARIVVAVSILFGVTGIIIGMLSFNSRMETDQTTVTTQNTLAPEIEGNVNEKTEYHPPRDSFGKQPRVQKKTVTRSPSQDKTSTAFIPHLSGNALENLTEKYKLTSTGKNDKGQYATIDKQYYFVGDELKGMTVTNILKDRVYLEGKKDNQIYVIVFRYP